MSLIVMLTVLNLIDSSLLPLVLVLLAINIKAALIFVLLKISKFLLTELLFHCTCTP